MSQISPHKAAVLILAVTLLFLSRTTTAAAPLSAASINYASSYLGAKIMEHSDEVKDAHHLLRDDSSYLIVPCSAKKKRFTVQMARDVTVKGVAIESLEYFSGIVENFVLLGNEKFPCFPPSCMWTVLGRFRANFSREVQYFQVGTDDGPAPTFRYLRFLWSSHYGREKSCTLTTFQIFGQDRFELAASIAPLSTEEVDLPSSPFALDQRALGPHEPTAGPTSWWAEPQGLNYSQCPATTVARDIDTYLEARRILELTCTWNFTRTTPVSDIISSRQLSWLKNNITAIRTALSQAATAQQLAELRDNVTRLVNFVNVQIDVATSLAERLQTLEDRIFWGSLVASTVVVTIILIGLGLAASRSKLQSGDSFFVPRSPRRLRPGGASDSPPFNDVPVIDESYDTDENEG